MKNLRYTILALVFSFIAYKSKAQSPEIVVNEYYNTSSQNDEWTELVVVKDNLSLVGWFIGDNNKDTDSWQPKIKFKDIALWKNLRAGTIILIDHASNVDNCNDITDVDKSDGFIRVCCRNSTYFTGGSNSTLFLADDGDFVQIVDPSGKMVHGIGHDKDPGTSVAGGTCFTTSVKWTNTNGAEAATRPCGNFLYYKFGMNSPTSLKVIAGTLSDFTIGIQTTTNNGFIDTTDTPFEGIGNGVDNNFWLQELRAPVFTAQSKCASKDANGIISIQWDQATDPFPSDSTIGYLVVRNQTGDFTAPQNGRVYALNATFGTGNQVTTVVKNIKGSQNNTFSENPGPGTFFYRVFPFRYKNTTVLDHPTRGRTYNTTQFVKVSSENFSLTITSDTICKPGKIKISADSDIPELKVAWFSSLTSNDTLPGGRKPLFSDSISQSRSYWASVSLGGCTQRFEVKALVNPLPVSYSALDSSCGGKVSVFNGAAGTGLTYTWSLLEPTPSGITGTRPDSINFQITTPLNLSPRTPIYYNVEVSRLSDGCKSTKKDTLFITPLTVSYQALDSACGGQTISISAPLRTGIIYEWTLIAPDGYSKFLNSEKTVYEIENIPPTEQKKRIDFSIVAKDGAGCVSITKSDSIIIKPLIVAYLAADSICEGTPVSLIGTNPALSYTWNLIEPRPLRIKTSKSDSAQYQIDIPSFAEKNMLFFTVSASDIKGCQSVVKKDSLFTVPFSASIVSNPIVPTFGDSILYAINSNKSNYFVNLWTVSNGTILSQTPKNLIATSTNDSIQVSADISTLLPNDARFCKVNRSLKLKVDPIVLPPLKPINNLITNNGDSQNNTLFFDRREVKNLEIFNRWGKKVHSASLYQNDWKPEDKEIGTYFYTAEVKESKSANFEKIAGWVQVVK